MPENSTFRWVYFRGWLQWAQIEKELMREKELIEDRRPPIFGYNYSALRDCLAKNWSDVSVTTIINRAETLNCYKLRQKGKVHDRLTTYVDDFSRKLLFAEFAPRETTWTHIHAEPRQ